jgi:ribose transport system permease protein
MSGQLKGGAATLLDLQWFWVLAIIILVGAVFTVVCPPGTFLTFFNLKNLLTDSSELIILTVGVTFVLIAGAIDLSLGSVLVLTTVVTLRLILVIKDATGVPLALVIATIFAVVFGALCGWVNGFLVARAKIPSFVATLATMGTTLGLARLASGGTNVPGVPIELMNLMTMRIAGFELSLYIALAVTLAGAFILNATLFGLYTFAVGSSVESARRAGIRVERHMVAIYMLMGGVAGIVAIIDLGRFGVASINAHTTDSLQAIAGAVIGGASLFGGRGTIVGAVLGAFIPALLRNGFIILGLQAYWQEVAVGVVLALAVYFDQWRRGKIVALQARLAGEDNAPVGGLGSVPSSS